jgi:formylmethanofuran dehydrogenase subunit E-like metal-binding protein
MHALFFFQSKAYLFEKSWCAWFRRQTFERSKAVLLARQLVVAVVIILASTESLYGADARVMIRDGMKALHVSKGDSGLCVVTDATYVTADGKGCGPYVDLIREETGCSVGKGNLLFLHRRADYPLKIVLFAGDTKECVALSYEGGKWEHGRYDISLDALAKKDAWQKIGRPLAPDGFAVVTLCHAWSAGAPEDLLKCAELHGHLCPGVTAGYMIARFIMERYPLKDQDQYSWIASPVYCKEDAIQVLLDVTPGKKTLITKILSTHEQEKLPQNTAGILVVWNRKEERGKGVVLGFDWSKAPEKDKLRKLLHMLSHADRPGDFVFVIKQFDVTVPIMERLTAERGNPYECLGLVK